MFNFKFLKINNFVLRIIALLSMLADHTTKSLNLIERHPFLFLFGRLAFPIFAFLLVEGFFHTKNLKKYYIKLFLLALISEIPFNILFGLKIFYPQLQNTIFTLLLGLVTIHILEIIKNKNIEKSMKILFSLFWIFLLCSLAKLFYVDYGCFGILFILVFYYARQVKYQYIFELIFLGILSYFLDVNSLLSFDIFNCGVIFPMECVSLFSLIFIWFYNGKLGYSGKYWKKFYYLFYPVHILILIYIRYLLYGIIFY